MANQKPPQEKKLTKEKINEIISENNKRGNTDYTKSPEGHRVILRDYYIEPKKNRKDSLAKENILRYLETRFKEPFETFLERFFPNGKISTNTAIWSFLLNEKLPIWQEHFDKKINNEVFEDLRISQEYYSTMDEVIQNQITSSFYFDQTEKMNGLMKIYQIGTEGKRIKITDIDGEFRRNMGKNKRFALLVPSISETEESKEKAERHLKNYIRERTIGRKKEAETNYQNAVIRWFIRSGIFNPRKAKLKTEEEKDLLHNLPNFDALNTILIAQYDSALNKEQDYSEEEDAELNTLIQAIFDKDEGGKKQIVARVFLFDTGFLDLTQQDNDISHVYWLPIITGHPDQQTGGVVYINSNKPISGKGDVLTKVRRGVPVLTFFFSGLFDDKQMQEIVHNHKLQTENGMGVAIMSRNIGHNIGSHTLSYEKSDLSDPWLALANDALEGLLEREEGFYKINQNVFREFTLKPKDRNENFELPYLKALSQFLNYLQERQDYISAYASTSHFHSGTVHLGADILSYFQGKNEGKKMQRNILMERLVRSENYRREDIVFEFDNETAKSQLSLPTGTVGRQAIFAILENIIRNTAKHGRTKERGRKKIRIKISATPLKKAPYYKVTISDNSSLTHKNANEKLEKIRASLSRPLTKKDGKLDESQKGIKEIQLAAAWLRGIPARDIISHDLNENTFKIITADYNQKHNGFTYTLYIYKAQKVLLVSDHEIKELPEGWSWSNPVSLVLKKSSKQFNFVLLDRQVKIKKIEKLLPVRLLSFNEHGLPFDKLKNINKQKEKSVLENLYKCWLKKETMSHGKKLEDYTVGIQDKKYTKAIAAAQITKEVSIVYEKELNSILARKPEIIFRTHNDTSSDFEILRKKLKDHSQVSFVEGISGNNSTERLIREDIHDDLWAYKMIESCMSRVLIIDERIWNEITAAKIEDNGSLSFSADTEFEYQKFSLKRIFIYTIRPIQDSPCHELVNLQNEPEAKIFQNGKLDIYPKSTLKKHFHFMSIHQGLLDKIYGEYDKKQFYNNFQEDLEITLRNFFHSGRSFTPDLPKDVGFIPLSSLDASLRDCKYNLSQLFFSGIIDHNV